MKKQLTDISFFKFIVRKEQFWDWLILIASTALGVLFIIHFYPYPGTMSDSFGYLSASIQDSFIPFRPFGYSYFLQMVNSLSRSIFSIVVSNAVIFCVSSGMLILAVKKYWSPTSRGLFYFFEVISVLNPLSLYMLDTIMSDSLFCSLIVTMLAMIIVVVNEQSVIASLIFILSFFFSLHTRYSAIFFPIAFIPILALYGKRMSSILCIAGMIVAFMIFRGQTSENMYESVRIRQASTGFEGWQLANNGLHIIPFIEESDVVMPDNPELASVHQFCMAFKDIIKEKTSDGTMATANFMWNNESPLKQMLFYYCDKNEVPYLSGWVRLGSGVFTEYGKWLILHYPGKFISHYLWPNMKQMFFPRGFEMVGNYKEVPAGKKEIIEFFGTVSKSVSSSGLATL